MNFGLNFKRNLAVPFLLWVSRCTNMESQSGLQKLSRHTVKKYLNLKEPVMGRELSFRTRKQNKTITAEQLNFLALINL